MTDAGTGQLPAGPPTIPEDRPWLKGANAFVRNTLWPRIERHGADYVPPDPKGARLGGLFMIAVPLTGLVLFVVSLIGDFDLDTGSTIFGAGLLLMIAGPVIGILGGRLITGLVSPKPVFSMDLEKGVVALVAEFLGFSFQPGEKPGCLRVRRLLRDADQDAFAATVNTVGTFFGIHVDPATALWSDRLATSRFGPPMTAWELSAGGFGGIAVRIPTRRVAADDSVFGVALGKEEGGLAVSRSRVEGAGYLPVVLESESFRRAFETYSKDQVAARRLLTPAVMPRLEAAVATIQCSKAMYLFADGHLSLLFDVAGDPFDYLYDETLASGDAVRRIFAEISALLDIAESLKIDSTTRL